MSLSVSNQLGGPRSSVVKYLLSVEVEPDVSIGWQYLVEPEYISQNSEAGKRDVAKSILVSCQMI